MSCSEGSCVECFRIWRVTANILNEKSQTEEVWSYSLGVWQKSNNSSPPKKIARYKRNCSNSLERKYLKMCMRFGTCNVMTVQIRPFETESTELKPEGLQRVRRDKWGNDQQNTAPRHRHWRILRWHSTIKSICTAFTNPNLLICYVKYNFTV
jgi:hypothetical protein